jgi:hypothetical protein
MFSVVLPFTVYEKLKAVARESETSIGELLRKGAGLVLRSKEHRCAGESKNVGN